MKKIEILGRDFNGRSYDSSCLLLPKKALLSSLWPPSIPSVHLEPVVIEPLFEDS